MIKLLFRMFIGIAFLYVCTFTVITSILGGFVAVYCVGDFFIKKYELEKGEKL